MSSLQRRLSEEENAELAALTAAVEAAIQARREWLDAKMHECSRLQEGDDIYDLETGARVGRVAELYRYWQDRDDGVRDTHVDCHYRYETSGRSFDNTSRQSGRSFGTRQDAIDWAEARTARLKGRR